MFFFFFFFRKGGNYFSSVYRLRKSIALCPLVTGYILLPAFNTWAGSHHITYKTYCVGTHAATLWHYSSYWSGSGINYKWLCFDPSAVVYVWSNIWHFTIFYTIVIKYLKDFIFIKSLLSFTSNENYVSELTNFPQKHKTIPSLNDCCWCSHCVSP